MKQLKIDKSKYKIGIDEIEGLKQAMIDVMAPIQENIKSKVYWNECNLEEAEYKSRDGFIAFKENCGGIYLSVVIPKCEEYEFDFLSFGEPTEQEENQSDEEWDRQREIEESEGHLDAQLRIWLKFEGLENNQMNFYLYMGGGNGDAPYFRSRYETTVFEQEFKAESLEEFTKNAQVQIKKLLKILK